LQAAQEAGSNLCLARAIHHQQNVVGNTPQFARLKELSSGTQVGSEYRYRSWINARQSARSKLMHLPDGELQTVVKLLSASSVCTCTSPLISAKQTSIFVPPGSILTVARDDTRRVKHTGNAKQHGSLQQVQ